MGVSPKKLLSRATAFTCMIAATQTGIAQESTAEQSFGLEEIVVTAQRRTERLQDVPIAISALNADDLAQRGVTDLSSLRTSVPGLQISTFAGANASNLVAIRGVSGQPLAIGGGQATAIYLDGVFLSRPDAAFFGLDDVERIEVLRGPQGTLYGRNATAGAINIITREPGSDFQGGADLSYGNYEAVAVRGSLSGPLGGGFSAGLSGSYDQRDGYFENPVTGNTVGDRESYTVRGKLRYSSPDDTFNATLSLDQSDTERYDLTKNGIVGTTFVGIGNPKLAPSEALAEANSGVDIRSRGASLTMTYALSDALNLTSITSFRDVTTDTAYDLDGSATPLPVVGPLYGLIYNFSKSFNQELRGTLTADRLRVTAGVNYFHENAELLLYPTTMAVLTTPAIRVPDPRTASQLDAYAAFTQVEFDVTDWMTAVAGLRYNKEERDFSTDYTRLPIRTPLGLFSQGSVEDDIVIPSAGLNFKVAPDVLVYVKASQGYQAPGFNGAPGSNVGNDVFDAEELWAYEVGAKTQFLDRRVTLNGAAFYYDYKDIQVRSVLAAGVVSIDNAAAATLQGVEVNLAVVPIDGLTVGTQLTYLDSQYDEYCEVISGGAPQGNDPSCAAAVPSADRKGNKLLQAPEWSGNANVGYSLPVGNLGELAANVSYSWQSNSFFSTTNESSVSTGAWDDVSARLSFQFTDGPEVYVYGKNLEDQRYYGFVLRANPLLVGGSINDPRTYGAGIKYRF